MQENLEEVHVELVNDRVRFEGYSIKQPEMKVLFDYKQPIGDGNGFNGLELLLTSLSGCSATAVVYLLRKMKKEILDFKLVSRGERTTESPIKFKKISLSFMLKSPDTTDAELTKCISLAEESVCPVWQMIKNNVQIETEFRIMLC